MAFLKFNKTELVNLSYSLKREIICANKTGAYCNTSIVTCNTRRYHGLLGVPVDNFSGNKHLLLSSLDESIIINGQQFNLGIHRYGNVYEPRGHKYIVDFESDPIPEITYKVGEIIFVKSILLAPDNDQVLIRYELVDAPAKIELQLKPFLAFRNIHSLTAKNDDANTTYREIKNGVAFKLYEGFPDLNMQLSSSKGVFKYNPYWYNGITYLDEYRRGFDCKEDLFVPGYFSINMKEGDVLYFSASVNEVLPTNIKKIFKDGFARLGEIKNEHDQLLHCADLLIRDRNGKKRITAGFSWLYTGLLRETLYALPGLTLFGKGGKKEFEEILDNLIKDEQERLFHRTTQVEAPLRLICDLQMYIDFGADEKQVWKKYGDTVKNIIKSYAAGVRKEISLQPDGLLWAQMDNVALTWMNAYVDGHPVTERGGYQVETNAYWYNALCFALEMEDKYGPKRSRFKSDWAPIRDLCLKNFQPKFLDPTLGYLADYIDNNGRHMEVRPNQLYAVWVKNSPIDDEVASRIMKVVENELITRRGVRTLSPRDVQYRGVYEGTQTERDLAYHQGSTRISSLYTYVDCAFRMWGATFYKKAEWLVKGFYEDLNKHGVGTFSELYDGDPPHEPHGAISSAMSTAALLGIEYLMNKYEED